MKEGILMKDKRYDPPYASTAFGRAAITGFLLMFLFLFAAAAVSAAGEAPLYTVDMALRVQAGLNEQLIVAFSRPADPACPDLTLTCSDPSAFTEFIDVLYDATDTRLLGKFVFQPTKKGQYTLYFSNGGDFRYEVEILVDDLATVKIASDSFTIQTGYTVPTGLALEGGVRYGKLRVGSYDTGIVSFSADLSLMTGLRAGTTTVYYYCGEKTIGSFTVTVMSVSENIRLSAQYDRSTVEYALPLTVTNENGQEVPARIEVTEGKEHAEVRISPDGVNYLYADSSGDVTVTAWGTDGSSDSLHIHVYELPASDQVQVNLPSETLAAGSSVPITVSFAEGTWAPVEFWFYDENPSEEGLEGSVAVVSDSRLLGLVPGNCILNVHAGRYFRDFSITVTQSAQACTIVRPKDGCFDWRESFQMAVLDGNGQSMPASFVPVSGDVSVSKDGILTSKKAEGYARVTVSLPNGASWQFAVRSKEVPLWLATGADVLSLPLDITYAFTEIEADIPIQPVYDVILCSSDESVLQIDGLNLLPQQPGTALVTVWSRYNDVYCCFAVQVTEPSGRLYVNGWPDDASMDLAAGETVTLPTVTDCRGNPVSVTWSVVYESYSSTYPDRPCVSLINNTSIRGERIEGYAELQAVSDSGNTLKLNVHCYQRKKTDGIRFESAEYSLTVGGYLQTALVCESSGMFSDRDVIYRLSGDTDCIRGSTQIYYYDITAVKEGNATLTATFYDGTKASTVIHVKASPMCPDGHDPVWYVTEPAGEYRNGTRVKICSRCGLIWGEETIPCTGTLRFDRKDYFVHVSDAENPVPLGTVLNGDYKQSFTWRSSDPSVAWILADRIIPLKPGTVTVTVSKGDCAPVSCHVHVIEGSALVLPAGLRTIEESAFEGCAASHICIPEGAQTIGKRAFADCASLQLIIIPGTVKSIADDAFASSAHLTIQCPAGSYAADYAKKHGIPAAEE